MRHQVTQLSGSARFLRSGDTLTAKTLARDATTRFLDRDRQAVCLQRNVAIALGKLQEVYPGRFLKNLDMPVALPLGRRRLV